MSDFRTEKGYDDEDPEEKIIEVPLLDMRGWKIGKVNGVAVSTVKAACVRCHVISPMQYALKLRDDGPCAPMCGECGVIHQVERWPHIGFNEHGQIEFDHHVPDTNLHQIEGSTNRMKGYF